VIPERQFMAPLVYRRFRGRWAGAGCSYREFKVSLVRGVRKAENESVFYLFSYLFSYSCRFSSFHFVVVSIFCPS
jgi:hypothetical protein